ncbi:MAG: hypothetical protein KKE20_04130 [Nanoarchaeota archaeon]|nr:hypothetical protein [Nanoarchaeota archaeon]
MIKHKKAAIMVTVIIGLVLVIMTFFPVGKAVAKGLGIAFADDSEKSFNDIISSIREIKPNEQNSIFAKMNDNSAIIGFTSDSNQISVIRTGFDFSFDKPPQCEGRACICLCKIMEHDTVMGSTAYFCKEPKMGEPDKYMVCENNLGVEILGFITKDKFSGDANLANYGVQGGFIIARASSTWGLVESGVFNIPKNPIIVVQKSGVQVNGLNFVAVCLNQDGCMESGEVEDQVNRMMAKTMYLDAEKAYKENTEQSRQKARDLFSQLMANQVYMNQLALITTGGAGQIYHLMHDYTYMFAAYNEMRDNKYDKAIEYAELAEDKVIDEDTRTQAKKDIERFKELKKEYEQQNTASPPLVS